MIHLENLCRHFEVGNQIVRALDEVDIEIDKNEYVSIISPIVAPPGAARTWPTDPPNFGPNINCTPQKKMVEPPLDAMPTVDANGGDGMAEMEP